MYRNSWRLHRHLNHILLYYLWGINLNYHQVHHYQNHSILSGHQGRRPRYRRLHQNLYQNTLQHQTARHRYCRHNHRRQNLTIRLHLMEKRLNYHQRYRRQYHSIRRITWKCITIITIGIIVKICPICRVIGE